MNTQHLVKDPGSTTPDSRNSFANACIEVIKFLQQDEDKVHTPNNIATKANVSRQTVEKAIKFLSQIQSEFFDNYELDVEEMNNNRKVVGISKRRKFSELPIELQRREIKRNYPHISEQEIISLIK